LIYDEKVQPNFFRQLVLSISELVLSLNELVLSINELALQMLTSPKQERDHIVETIVLHVQVDVAMLEQSLCWETSLGGSRPLLATYLDIGLEVPKVVPQVHITLDCRERHLHYSNSKPMQTTLRSETPSIPPACHIPQEVLRCNLRCRGSLEVQSAL
jgi:hypothetical protein